MATVLITGGTGFIGRNLIPLLQQAGHDIVVLSRTPAQYQSDFFFRHSKLIGSLNEIEQADIVINLAGENLSNKRWSNDFKHKIKQSRIETTIKLLDWMAACDKKPFTFISGSAIGYYGAQGNEELPESAPAGNEEEFQVSLCKDWESCAERAQGYGIRTCLIRTGVVLGDEGALSRMLLPFKFGLGGKLGHGEQYFSWIHIHDHVRAVKHLIDSPNLSGPFNLTSPNPVTNETLTKTLGKVLNRPTFMSVPGFALKLAMGEMAEILLTGQRVVPQKLLESGFKFKYPELEAALNHILK